MYLPQYTERKGSKIPENRQMEHPDTLRRFRDYYLARRFWGRCFIRAYYAVSPTLVRWFGDTSWFRKLWRGPLDRLVNKLRKDGVASTPYRDCKW